MFFGEANSRKVEANSRIGLMEWASNTEELLMLISQLQNIFRLATQGLITIDEKSNEVLYDNAVPNYGAKEKLQVLLQRIDSNAQQLTIYRNMVDEGKNKGHTLSAVVDSVQGSVLAHVPSLNNKSLQQPINSFIVQSGTSFVDDGVKSGIHRLLSTQKSQHLQQVAFQAGEVHATNKKNRSYPLPPRQDSAADNSMPSLGWK